MEYLWIAWIIAGLVFATAEIFTLGFVLLWFGVGAFVAAALALAGAGWVVQVLAFLVVSAALTIASRTIFEKVLFGKQASVVKTGVANLPGQIGTVVEPSRGALAESAVKVFGSTWTAYPVDGEGPLEEGERVAVDRVDGAVLYVRRIRDTEGAWRQ